MNGLILLDKPEGVTSFAALGGLKRALGTRKVGHTGTLDPFATGLMVVLSGSCTRLAEYVTALDRHYEARFRFGLTSDTLDRDGDLMPGGTIPERRTLEDAIRQQVGLIEQVPPAYSAIRVAGERAHGLARQGTPPVLAPRTVEVFSFELREWTPPDALISVHCSKGTYIRSLVRDVAADVGTVGLVQELRRISVGPFQVVQAVPPEAFDPARDVRQGRQVLEAIAGARAATVAESAVARVRNGGRLAVDDVSPDEGTGVEPGRYGLFDAKGALLALADYDGDRFRWCCVLDRAG